MKSSVYIPPKTELQPNQRIYLQSQYTQQDVPGKWVFVRLADGLHTTDDMCIVRQLPPYRYPVEEGVIALKRVYTTPWTASTKRSQVSTRKRTTTR